MSLTITPLPVDGEIRAGDDLAGVLAAALARAGESVRDGDVLVVAQKAVSKAEGRRVELAGVEPSPRALAFAEPGVDPRVVEVVLREAAAVVRRRGSLIICETPHGHVCAAAGVDQSNAGGGDAVHLLPRDPDASARALHAALAPGLRVAVIVSDSFGRPFRTGIQGVALGCAGIAPVVAWRGRPDDAGRPFEGTEVAVADALAAAADLVMGPAGGVPAALVRGAAWQDSESGIAPGLMPRERDLFRDSGPAGRT